MKKLLSLQSRLLSVWTAAALLVSLCAVPAYAAEETAAPAGSVTNVSEDGGEDCINLSAARSFQARIPVSMTEEAAAQAAGKAEWSLLRDSGKAYLDPVLYPNQTAGGGLSDWVCSDGETPFFTNVVSFAETVDGQVYLSVSFDSVCYFGSDASVPHSNGGAYLDVCGYFRLTALVDGKALGSAPVKITPYDNFHTMPEIYAQIDAMVSYAAENTDLYVEKRSMGKSQGDNGLEPLDMPYLIVAKNPDAVAKWQSIQEEAEHDPSALIAKLEAGTLGDYQVPVLYSNVHANEAAASDGILKFAWMLLEAAAADGKLDYDRLTGFTAEGEAELAAQMGPVGAEGSVAVPDLVADTATYLGYLKGEGLNVSGVVDLAKYYTIETETVDVDELLSDVFFLIVPEENVEGRTYLTRTSSGGFDLNRDNSFQTQAETQNMTQLIAAWNPVSFTEFHGRVKQFQCEPCDPPHEPNFEYDLLAEHLMAGGEALGIAAVANNDGYNSYVIPQRDYLSYTGAKAADGADQTCWYDPWDDMSTSYTPQYAMLHGTVAYTVEVPAYNDDVAAAVAYGQLGQSAYIAENKQEYLLAQTKIFERGVTNANSDAYELVGQWFCDQYDVEGAEAELFRPEYDGAGQNGNFYPECYIIPLDGANQSNLQAAADMMEWLSRNDVKILVSETAFSYSGVRYPAGTMVVSLYQAKRSVANGALYDGTVITGWPVLYSEGITAFAKTRGFDMVTCAEPTAYRTIRAACGDWMDHADCVRYLANVTSSFTGVEGAKVILSNASEDSTAAVNALLQAGKGVGMILSGEQAGSFLCDYSDWRSVCTQYRLSGAGVAEADAPLSLTITKAPVVYISGKPSDSRTGFVKTSLVSGSYQYNYDRQAMELLGFQVTDDASLATLVIGAAALDEAGLAAVENGAAYIGYGSNAISAITGYTDRRGNQIPGCLLSTGSLVRETVSSESMDALAYVTYPTQSLITASYVSEGDELLYGYGAGYFSAIPEGAQVLIRLDGAREPLEGFLVGGGEHYDDFLDNSIQAISYQKDGLNLALFANTLTNKLHQRDEFNFISNMAFSSLLGGVYAGSVKTAGDAKALADAKYTDVGGGDWYAEAVGQATAQGLFTGTSGTTFAPAGTTTRGMLVTVLHRLAGLPEAEAASFTDVAADSYCADAVAWAAEHGVTSGTSAAAFSPNAALTREQTVTMLYRYAQAAGADVSVEADADLLRYADAGQISVFALPAMQWACGSGVLTGNGAGALNPQGTASRAELATLILRAAELF